MRTFDYILEGSEATLDNAIAAAKGLDWQEIETTENDSLPYLEFKEEHNGVEIWYCYAGDIYLFTDINDN